MRAPVSVQVPSFFFLPLLPAQPQEGVGLIPQGAKGGANVGAPPRAPQDMKRRVRSPRLGWGKSSRVSIITLS